MSDPIGELQQITAYETAAFNWITQANALIAQLQAASNGNPAPTNSDSTDVEAAIDAILAFQTANPVPTAPTAVAAMAPSQAPVPPAAS